MVQIIEEAPRRQSFLQKLNVGVGRGLEAGQQLFQQHQQRQQEEAQKEAIRNLIGPGTENLPFEFQKLLIQESQKANFLGQEYDLKGQQQTELELLKQQGKENLFGKKQDLLSRILGGQTDKSIHQQPEQDFDPSQISDADIARAAAVDPAIARELRAAKDAASKRDIEEKKLTRKEQFEREKLGRAEETAISKPVLLEMNQIRKNIPLQEQAIEDIKTASPKVGWRDYAADVLGFEPARTAEGVKLKTGIKDFFLSDLSRAGARPNQWIEQQLADALPKIGRSEEANLITAEGLQFKVDLAKRRLELIDELSEGDIKKDGFVRGNIDARAYQKMKKYVIDRQKELYDNIKKIKAEAKGKKDVVKMKGPDGSVWEILSNDIDEAIENGYDFTE